MHAGVVELDPLPDPVGPRAQDDDRFAFPRLHLGLGVVAGVVVGRVGGEFRSAGVHGLVDRPDAQRVPHPADHVFAAAAQGGQLEVRKARALCSPQ